MLFVLFLRHSPSLFPEGNLVYVIDVRKKKNTRYQEGYISYCYYVLLLYMVCVHLNAVRIIRKSSVTLKRMPNAVVTGLKSESTKNGFITQSGRKYKKGGCRVSIRIPKEPVPGAPRHFFCTKIRENTRRTWCVRPIYSHI